MLYNACNIYRCPGPVACKRPPLAAFTEAERVLKSEGSPKLDNASMLPPRRYASPSTRVQGRVTLFGAGNKNSVNLLS